MASYPIANGDIAQVTVYATYQNSRILNVWHYEAVVPAGIADGAPEVANLIAKFEENVIDPVAGVKWVDLLVDSYQFDYIQGQVVFPTRRYFETNNLPIAGTNAAPGCASNIGATAWMQSNKVGRGRAGSKHFTGFANADVASGLIEGGIRADLELVVQHSIADVPGVDPGLTWKARIWSNARPGDINEIVNVYVWPETRIMRRRTLHVGI